MSVARPATRTLLPFSAVRTESCRCRASKTRCWTRQQSSFTRPQSPPKPKRDRRYYLLALPLAFLPFSFFGSSKRPLDPYTYSDHPIASTSKLTPHHARIRIPLSSSDAGLFARGTSKDGVLTVEHVMIKNPDLQIERPYTPVNDVARDGELDLVVKRVQGGEVGRMIHRLQPGGQVGLRGPIATMAIRPEQYDKIIMISTGTGVAPFLQLLNKITPTPQTQLELIHSLPRPSDQEIDFDIVKHESLLPALATRHPGLIVTRPPPGPIPTHVLESALSAKKDGKRILVLVCLPQSLMRPLCGGLTIDMKQGEVSGTLGRMGLTSGEVYKLE